MCLLLVFCTALIVRTTSLTVVQPHNVTRLETMALKEARRYLGQLSGERVSSMRMDSEWDLSEPAGAVDTQLLFLATRDHQVQETFTEWNSSYTKELQRLTHPDAHMIHSLRHPEGASMLVCTGATPQAVLYCVYSLLEVCGARFYLHGDVLPPAAPLTLPRDLHRSYTPRFNVRGERHA